MISRPITFERLCDSCSGTGVIPLTPEEEKHEPERLEREKRDREAKLEEQTWQRLVNQAIQQYSSRGGVTTDDIVDDFVKGLLGGENAHMIERLPGFLADERFARAAPPLLYYNHLRVAVARLIGSKNYADQFRRLAGPLLPLLKNESIDFQVRGGVAVSLDAYETGWKINCRFLKQRYQGQ